MAAPNYLSSTIHRPHPPQPPSMTTFEPQVVGDLSPDPESNSVTIAVLSTEIEILTVAKNAVEITPAKAAFESTIAILTLVRVRISVLLLFLHLLIGNRTRTRR